MSIKIQTFDFNVDLLRSLIWQYDTDDDLNITGLIKDKQSAITILQNDFWDNWIVDIFNLTTANSFGLSVWAFILDVPLLIEATPRVKAGWGFGSGTGQTIRRNFNNGNFNLEESGIVNLTQEQIRIILKMKYAKLTTRGTIPEINLILKNAFGDIGSIFCRDNLDMTTDYVTDFEVPTWITFIFENLDIFPTPAAVEAKIGLLGWSKTGNGLKITTFNFPALTALTSTDIAFIDATNDELRTYTFDGSNWSQVGNSLAIATVGNPALTALTSTDIAFIDATNEELRIYTFDGSDWSQVGNSLAIATVENPAITALNDTNIAFIDSDNKELRTYTFDGSDWSQVGNSLTIVNIGVPAISALNDTDIAFIDGSSDELRTYTFDGSDWSQVGNSLAIVSIAIPSLTAFNTIDIAFVDNRNNEIRTYRFDGTDWIQLKGILETFQIGIPAISALSTTSIAFIDATNEELRTYRYGAT